MIVAYSFIFYFLCLVHIHWNLNYIFRYEKVDTDESYLFENQEKLQGHQYLSLISDYRMYIMYYFFNFIFLILGTFTANGLLFLIAYYLDSRSVDKGYKIIFCSINILIYLFIFINHFFLHIDILLMVKTFLHI